MRVVWDGHSRPRYRFSIDDNSFFLRDVAQNKYASLFDCFYLEMLRKLHKKYAARFVLNIYYTTGDGCGLPIGRTLLGGIHGYWPRLNWKRPILPPRRRIH